MAKIVLPTITSGYASNTTFNNAFDSIESEFHNNVLYRNNPAGEPNEMQNDLDMNSNNLLNVGSLEVTSFIVGGVDYIASMNSIYNNYVSITQKVTISTNSPSGGAEGDIWFKLAS